MPTAWNRFFAARRKRGLSAKQIGREWRAKKRGTRKGQVRKTARRAFARRSNPKKGGNPVARKRKNININLVDLGGGIVLADQFLGEGAMDSILAFQMPDLKLLPSRLRDPVTQGALIKTGVGIAVLKTALRGFSRQVGAIGPIKLKV